MINIYLAGPMSGIPEFNFPAFMDMADYLRQRGYNVFNPAEHDIERVGHDFSTEAKTGDAEDAAKYGITYRKCLKADLTWICDQADAMYMLTGWEKSKGCQAEHSLAKALDIPIFYERTI
jgi:hypothetical protein